MFRVASVANGLCFGYVVVICVVMGGLVLVLLSG